MIEEQIAIIGQGQIHSSGSGEKKKKRERTVNTESRGPTLALFYLPSYVPSCLNNSTTTSTTILQL